MNRTASISVKGLNLKYLKENSTFIALITLVLISLFLGVMVISQTTYFGLSSEMFDEYVTVRRSGSFGTIFLTVFLNTLKLPLTSYLFGTSVLGLVISPLLMCYASFSYGMLSGYVYSSFGLSGIVFNLFVLLLPQLISTFCLVLSSLECINFSKKIANICIKDRRPINLYQDFKMFCIKHLVLIVPVFVSSILDITLFKLLENYISF